MGTTVAILVFCGLMAWLLYRFKLSKANSTKDVRKLLPFFFALGVFLGFNALLAFMGRGGLNLAMTMKPVTSLAVLSDTKTGDGVILDGVVSAKNSGQTGDYVAYIGDERLYSPNELLIELDDGIMAVSNDTYAARNWPVDGRSFSYLKASEPVIVVGHVERSIQLLGADNGQQHLSIRADIVYAGDHADFVARAKQRILLPTIMLIANVIAMVVVVIIPIIFWLKSPKKR